MKRLAAVLAILAFILPAALSGAAEKLDPRTAVFGPPAFTPTPPIEKTLTGGAKLFLAEDHDVGLVRVYVNFLGGALSDPEGREGLADIAGQAWRAGGTADKTPEAFDEALEARGIHLGLSIGRESGGATLSALPGDLDTGLALLSDLLFSPAFDAERFTLAVKDREDELKREEDDPDTVAYRELRSALYKNHPRGRRVTAKSLAAVTRQDAMELSRALVDESAWVVGAVGDFDAAEMAKKLEARFGRLKFNRAPRFARPAPPVKPEPTLVVVKKPLAQTTLLWASFGPAIQSRKRAPMEVADFVFGGGGFQSRLSRKIRIERGLAYAVGSFYSPNEDFGVVGMQAATATTSTGEVWKLMSGELAEAGATPFTSSEVEEARRTEQNRYIFRFEDPASLVTERMSLELKGLPGDLVERYYRELSAVTPEAVLDAAATSYMRDAGVWVLVGDVSADDPVFAGPWKKITLGAEGTGSR